MRHYQYILTFFFLFNTANLLAQESEEILIDPILIHLKGVLINRTDSTPVPFASVVNLRTHGGTTTNPEGRFSLQALNVDSLRISAMGYMREWIAIPPDQHQDSIFVIKLRPIVHALGEVTVVARSQSINNNWGGTGKPSDISPELRGDAFNSKPSLLAAVFAPASFLQYHLSRKEKAKRQARQTIVDQQNWERLSVLYNKDMVMNLTGLNDEDSDDFMIWFNAKSLLTSRSTEYDVRAAITHQYEIYKKEKNEQAGQK